MYRLFKYFFPVLILYAGFVIVLSCNGSGGQRSLRQESNISEYDSTQGKSLTYNKYELPLSVDVYKLLKIKKYAFDELLMHKLKDQDKYFTEFKRAFALGVYSSDLAYASVYEQSQDAVNYFNASIELAHKLNIQDGYNSKTLDRAYENIDNEDSLSYIAGESYYRTCSILEKEKRDNILPLVVIGSWIESMHILSKACLDSPAESGLFEEFYTQMKHLEKLLNYTNDALNGMQHSDSKAEILKVVELMNSIQEKFKLIENASPSEIGAAQFKDVISQIEYLRNTMLE